MKKTIALILCIVLCAGMFAACGDNGSTSAPSASNPSSSVETDNPGNPDSSTDTLDVTDNGEAPIITAEEAKNIKSVELIFHTHEPATSDASINLQSWFDLIHEVSGGTITITPYFGGILGTQNDSYYMLQDGSCDITWATQNAAQGAFPMSELFSIPRTGVSSAAMGSHALMDMLEETDFLTDEYSDFYVICLHAHNPANMVLMKDGDYDDISDFNGLTINTTGSWQTRYLKDIGVNVVSISKSEIYSSVEKGVVDGIVGDFNNVRSYGLYELAKCYVMVELNCVPGYIMMNLDKYNSLAPAQQEIFDYYGGRYLLDNYLDPGWASSVPYVYEKAEEYGGVIIEPSETLSNQLTEAAIDLQTQWIDIVTANGYDGQGAFDWLQNWLAEHADEY